MATFIPNIDGEESATVTFSVGAISILRGTTNELQEILCLGDPESSVAIARISSVAPKSTDAGLNVRIIGGPSTASDFSVRAVLPSTATDNLVQISGNSTAFQGGSPWNVLQNSTIWQVQAHNSSIGDLLASAQQNSTVWQVQAKIQDSSAVTFAGATRFPTTGAQGLVVRQTFNDIQSTATSTAGNTSTSTPLVSSVASQRIKVFAYAVTSTIVSASTWYFQSSAAAAQKLWDVVLGSQSSGVTGITQSVSPPAWLFATTAGEALNFITQSSAIDVHVSLSYLIES